MKKNLTIFLLGFLWTSVALAQTIVKGSVKDANTDQPIPDVTITIEGTSQSTKTNARGEFMFTGNVLLLVHN